MKNTPLRATWVRWMLLVTLAVSNVASAQSNTGGLPPPGTMSAQMPEGMELFFSMSISDADQQVSQNMGASAAEARLRSLQACKAKYKGCVELVTFPIRNHCMAIAADTQAKPNARSLFVNVAETSTAKPGELAQKSLEQCKAGGGATCASQSDYCF
ncbi:MAG: DUF4189 domain-containing protein [Pseudomonas sp.]|uniref:DUF4189 domain-containing protein n=1 Tax=Stenotrophomonas sp. TaxID=69392 RepID=UPI003D6DA1AF